MRPQSEQACHLYWNSMLLLSLTPDQRSSLMSAGENYKEKQTLWFVILKFYMKSVLLNPLTSRSRRSWLRLHTLLCTQVPAVAPQWTKIAIFNLLLVIPLPRIVCFNNRPFPPHNNLKIKSDTITSVAYASLFTSIHSVTYSSPCATTCCSLSRQGCIQVTPESEFQR